MPSISHALVLPDKDFDSWLAAARAYLQAFERIAVVRSPAGFDLNRFRNVTAVQAPLTWFQDDAVAHIRRAYPMVVRIDVITVEQPEELTPILQARITAQDRYGEKQTPSHIYDRFTLEWFSPARPARILRGFSTRDDNNPDAHEGIEINAPQGSQIMAAAAGQVISVALQPTALGYGQYVQIASQLRGQNFIVTYGYLQNIKVIGGQLVKVGDQIAEAAAQNRVKVVVQNPPGGVSGFPLPNVIDPTPLIYWQDIRLRPIADGLRLRSLPSTTDGQVISQVNSWDWLETKETHGRTLLKVGVEGQWLHVPISNNPAVKDGYAAAWLLEARTLNEPIEVFPGVNPVGVNLDVFHPLGTPDPARLKGMGWVRLGYNVSAGVGSQDINAAFNRYRPVLQRYVNAGYRVVLTTSHQTYGEGIRDFWPWPEMTDDKWTQLIAGFSDMMRRIAAQYAGTGLVHAWQVWNEQDAPIGAVASVPMTARNYARMMTAVIQAIRTADPRVFIITGGHTGGPVRGGQYARETIANMPGGIRPDGIAHHPYGRGATAASPYAPFGQIDDEIRAYAPVLPDKPLWITEWGVLDHPNDSPDAVNKYAMDMISYLKSHYPAKIATLIWYAWAQGMHNGYGLVDQNDQPRHPLLDNFLKS
jgi:hypothetical protein